jgi:hypothetical protein
MIVKAIRTLLAAIVFAASGLLSPAWATAFTTDQSDLWWDPAESGWGIQFVHRGSVMFATVFVYDPTLTPIWYTATLNFAGNLVWTGDLYVTTGPWFGAGSFDPDAVGRRKVGTMSWNATTTRNGTLTYGVDGVTVGKSLTRQFLGNEDFGGRYGGGIHSDTTGCVDPALNGTAENFGMLDITQDGQTITLTSFPATSASCSFSGALDQAGQMGSVGGSYACSGGDTGEFQLFEMQVNISGMTGRLSTASNTATGCRSNGWLGGVRAQTF